MLSKVIRKTVIQFMCDKCGEQVAYCNYCYRKLEESWIIYCNKEVLLNVGLYKNCTSMYHYCSACKDKIKKNKARIK